MQGNWETGNTPDSIHSWLVKAWNLSEGRYNLNMAEFKTHDNLSQSGDREGIRKVSWAIAMAGSYIMVLGMDIENTPPEQLQDCRYITQFFESTGFNTMAPHDELKYAGTQYVLASPGYSYIAYSSENSENPGLKNMVSGEYNIRWYDCVTGQTVQTNNIKIASDNQSWEKPKELGDEIALYLTKTDGQIMPDVVNLKKRETSKGEKTIIPMPDIPNILPVAPDQRITTKKDTPVYIQLTYNDPDGGPGPYQTAIIINPSYGKLSGEGNDQTYTPVIGYTGTDIFTWKVNDGADYSEIAKVFINVVE